MRGDARFVVFGVLSIGVLSIGVLSIGGCGDELGAITPIEETVLACGSDHTCTVKDDGTVWCWGQNSYGEVGLEPCLEDPSCANLETLPRRVEGISDVRSIAASFWVTCAVTGDETAWCWGMNHDGSAGWDTEDGSSFVPIPVAGLQDVEEISPGHSSCALTGTGEVWCWGWNGWGGLGVGHVQETCNLGQECSRTPLLVDLLHNVRQISGSGSPTCALEENGRVWCWGTGRSGELGDGEINHEVCEYDRDCSRTPVRVIDIDDAIYISAGDFHACAVRRDGTVWCWGSGDDRLGDGKQVHQLCANGSDCSPFPVQVVGLNDTVQVSTSGPHTCALGRKGRVWCWGSNSSGQLGDGTTENSNVPVRVKDLGQAVQISAGAGVSCALTTDGKRWCWGSNWRCKLGTDCDWNGIEQSSVPVKVELP